MQIIFSNVYTIKEYLKLICVKKNQNIYLLHVSKQHNALLLVANSNITILHIWNIINNIAFKI